MTGAQLIDADTIRRIIDDELLARGPESRPPLHGKELRVALCGCFATSLPKLWTQLHRLMVQLTFELEVNDRGEAVHVLVLEGLRSHLGGSTSGRTDDGDRWREAIRILLANDSLERMRLYSRGLHDSDRLVLDALKRLRGRGFDIRMQGGQASAEKEEWTRLFARLDDCVAAAGGVAVAHAWLPTLASRFSHELGRFQLGQRYGPDASRRPQDPPHGLLLRTCLRHPFAKPSEPDLDDEPPEDPPTLFKDAALLAGAVWTSNLQGIFVGPASLQDFLAEAAHYDLLYSPRQLPPRHAQRLIRGVWGAPSVRRVLEAIPSARGLLHAAETLIAELGDGRNPRYLRERKLLRGVPVEARGHAKQALRHWLVTDASSPRPPLNPFEDEPEHVPERPLLEIARHAWWAPPGSFAAPLVIDALHRGLSAYLPSLPKLEGIALERHLVSEMRRLGVDVACGTFDVVGEKGDVDAVVIGQDVLALFELKRRPMSSSARIGLPGFILRDLTVPLVHAHNQLLRQELLLRRHGELRLVDHDGQMRVVRLEHRRVERFAVSMLDFGGLQVREAARQVLRTALNLEFDSSDPALARRMQELSRELELLRDRTKELLTYEDSRSDADFMNAGFVSVPYLYALLDAGGGTEGFVRQLALGRNISASTRNPYDELAYARRLDQRAPRP